MFIARSSEYRPSVLAARRNQLKRKQLSSKLRQSVISICQSHTKQSRGPQSLHSIKSKLTLKRLFKRVAPSLRSVSVRILQRVFAIRFVFLILWPIFFLNYKICIVRVSISSLCGRGLGRTQNYTDAILRSHRY